VKLHTGDHKVFFYRRRHDYAESVYEHIRPAIEDGLPLVIIATAAHHQLIDEYLHERDLDPDVLRASQAMIQLDAAQTLEKFFSGNAFNEAHFHREVNGLLATVAKRDVTPRFYGEMVDLLAKCGKHDAAITLEQLWNDLAEQHAFSLLCGYEMDMLSDGVATDFLRAACREHSYVQTLSIDLQAIELIKSAIRQSLGREAAQDLWLRVSTSDSSVPPEYAAMLWLRRNLPALADNIRRQLADAN
jgi:hypothetical protein